MTAGRLPAAVRDLLRGSSADADLLARFVAGRDETAFAELVRRHGGPVWDVCRSVLRNTADADDAFQATFLTLARRAAQLRKPASVGAWLHGVAVRVARKARAAASRRQLREAEYEPVPAADPGECDVRAVVHEALAGLPARYREPLVACYLRGLTHDDTAAELGLSKAAVKKRLERGRDRLRAVLRSRGLGPAVVLVAAGPAPAQLTDAATRFATGSAPVPPAVLTLVEGAVPMTFAKYTAALLLAAGVGLAVAAQETPRTPNVPPPPAPETKRLPPARSSEAPAAKSELEGAWTVSWIETNGAAIYDAKNHDETLPAPTFVFSGDRCEVKGVRVLYLTDFRFKTDATVTPKEIDATILAGPKKGETVVGIYLVRDNELRMCLRLQGTQFGRPKGYVTNSGTTLYTFLLRRGAKAAAAPRADLKFDAVLRSGNKLYLVLHGPTGKSFPDELAPFAERLDLAVKTADRVKEKDLTVVLFRPHDFEVAKDPTGSWSGFTREQLARYAAEDSARRIDKLAEHAWTVGRLPKDATPLPPEPPQPKVAPPKEVSVYDRVLTPADLPTPGTQVTSAKDRQRVYYFTNAMRMWAEPKNAGKHPGLYASKDAGKAWGLVNTSFDFKALFVHPKTGDLFAAIEHAWNGTDPKDGKLTRFHADKAVRSADGGATWKDITPPPGHLPHVTSFFADPDHAGRACVVANVIRDVIYRPKDDRYAEFDLIRAASVEGERLMVRGGAFGEER